MIFISVTVQLVTMVQQKRKSVGAPSASEGGVSISNYFQKVVPAQPASHGAGRVGWGRGCLECAW